MLQGGLRNLESVLRNLTGRPVVFVVTNGTYTQNEENRTDVPHVDPNAPVILARQPATKYAVAENRLVMLWYGKMNPVGDNNTEQGRRLNRISERIPHCLRRG